MTGVLGFWAFLDRPVASGRPVMPAPRAARVLRVGQASTGHGFPRPYRPDGCYRKRDRELERCRGLHSNRGGGAVDVRVYDAGQVNGFL